MKIKELRFIRKEDTFVDLSFQNWSRCFEYGYVISQLKNMPAGTKIHNTSCGIEPIHRSFQKRISQYGTVRNSDIISEDKYDIRELSGEKYDVVLCISTLEHMKKNERSVAFNNLLSQTRKRLIITCDYPDISMLEAIGFVKNHISGKCDFGMSPTILTGENSPFPVKEFSDKKIILLDIEI